ncbi:hypothetical protein Droror1_Dr00015769 [Drosera rotundifolia]
MCTPGARLFCLESLQWYDVRVSFEQDFQARVYAACCFGVFNFDVFLCPGAVSVLSNDLPLLIPAIRSASAMLAMHYNCEMESLAYTLGAKLRRKSYARLELLKRDVSRRQGGVSILLVILVGLIGVQQ